MSDHTEKTLSSIRSIIDEWSIRKEGGKQSFFILKEIDKLLADTPIDKTVTDNEIADKRNDVGALREANETIHNAQIYIDTLKAELSNSKSAIVMKNGVINDRVEHLERVYNQLHGFQDDVYEKNKTIDELNETISDLRMAASDMLDTINECSRREAEDSKVLMRVVKTVEDWDERNIAFSMSQIIDIVKTYPPESPVVTLKTTSIGTRVVSKNEETHIIDEAKMEAVRMLVGSDMWVLHTDEEAVEDKQQKETIDELTETTRKLEGRLSSMYAANSDQDTTINKLNALLADEKMTLAAYRSNPLSDQVADRDKRIEQSMVLNEALRIDMELAHNLSRDHIAGQDRFIEGLKTELDARNTAIKDFKAIEQKETDRLHTVIEGNGKIIDELNDMYCDVCGKLERIEKIIDECCMHTNWCVFVDKIKAVIQEE